MTEGVTPMTGTVYLAPEGFAEELRAELGRDAKALDTGAKEPRLFFAPGPRRKAAWAANVWLDPVQIRVASVAQAAMQLKALGREWALFPTQHRNRADVIESNLPKVARDPLIFPAPAPTEPLGSWAMTSPDAIVAAAKCTSPFANGEARFVEDHTEPPSRAYLKLWEAFTLAGTRPKPGSRCVDLGSSPGGWTWVLEKIGARVMSVDKAPLSPRLMKLTRVRYVQESAFALEPAKVGKVDWLFSNVICYPDRITKLIQRWIAVHPSVSCVITIKLQGEADLSPLRALDGISHTTLRHLHHNRHELTWMRIVEQTP